MNGTIRRKLEMATRARDFVRGHPDANPGYVAAAARLEECLLRAEALARQEVAVRQAVSAAVVSKEQLRAEAYDTILLLAGLAGPASREAPELADGIARPVRNSNHQAFLTRSRVALETASAHSELLARYGLPEGFLEALGAVLDRFEGSLQEKHAGRLAHVGAIADLRAVCDEVMAIVNHLDALNRFRFREDAEALGAWKSARNVSWPASERRAARREGEVKPAA